MKQFLIIAILGCLGWNAQAEGTLRLLNTKFDHPQLRDWAAAHPNLVTAQLQRGLDVLGLQDATGEGKLSQSADSLGLVHGFLTFDYRISGLLASFTEETAGKLLPEIQQKMGAEYGVGAGQPYVLLISWLSFQKKQLDQFITIQWDGFNRSSEFSAEKKKLIEGVVVSTFEQYLVLNDRNTGLGALGEEILRFKQLLDGDINQSSIKIGEKNYQATDYYKVCRCDTVLNLFAFHGVIPFPKETKWKGWDGLVYKMQNNLLSIKVESTIIGEERVIEASYINQQGKIIYALIRILFEDANTIENNFMFIGKIDQEESVGNYCHLQVPDISNEQLENFLNSYINKSKRFNQIKNNCSISIRSDAGLVEVRAFFTKKDASGALGNYSYVSRFKYEWRLNGNIQSDTGDYFDLVPKFNLLKTGENTIELKIIEKKTNQFRNIQMKILFDMHRILEEYRVIAYVNNNVMPKGDTSLYKHNGIIGDRQVGDLPLENGNRIKLVLLRKNGKSWIRIDDNIVWKYEGQPAATFIITGVKNVISEKLATVKLPNTTFDFNVRIIVNKIIEITTRNTYRSILNFDPKVPKTDRPPFDTSYVRYIRDSLRRPDIVNYLKNNPSVGYSITIVPSSKMPTTDHKGNNTLVSNIVPGNYPLLSVTNLVRQDKKPVTAKKHVVFDALLVSGLKLEELDDINIAISKRKVTEYAKALLIKIGRLSRNDSINLYNNIISGQAANNINLIRYAVDLNDVSDYNDYSGISQTIIINADHAENQTDAGFAKTLTHEIGHGYFQSTRPLIALKWDIIRSQSMGQTSYSLDDVVGANGHCSGGSGHERYNPENQYVCNLQ